MPDFSDWVLFAEAAEGPHGTTGRHFFNSDTPSAEFPWVCYTLAMSTKINLENGYSVGEKENLSISNWMIRGIHLVYCLKKSVLHTI